MIPYLFQKWGDNEENLEKFYSFFLLITKLKNIIIVVQRYKNYLKLSKIIAFVQSTLPA